MRITISNENISAEFSLSELPLVTGYLDAIHTARPRVPLDVAFVKDVRDLALENKIAAIKLYRERTGLPLRECLAYVDRLLAAQKPA